MTELLHWFTQFVKENGLVGTLLLLFVLDRINFLEKVKKFMGKEIEVPHRRKDDDQLHYHIRVKDTAKLLNEWMLKMEEHLKKEALEDIRMAKLEAEQVSLAKSMETENGHIFKQLGSLHEKMDSLITILIQQNK